MINTNIIIKKIFNKTIVKLFDMFRRYKDCASQRSFFSSHNVKHGIIESKRLRTDSLLIDTTEYLFDMYILHRYDILGSGWQNYSYKNQSNTCPDNANFKLSTTIDRSNFSMLIDYLSNKHLNNVVDLIDKVSPDYSPIDWQSDIKSGYRFSEKTWYKHIVTRPGRGIDVKMPWEISNLQHLVQLALFCNKMPDRNKVAITEFRNQIIDFIVTNPVRFGVNWSCSMLIAIRAVNMLIAYDLFSQLDQDHGVFDKDFKRIFSYSIYQHGQHIYTNLENKNAVTANHYYANIVGLLYISIYIEETPETRKWLIFAVKEFFKETNKQFYSDGSNFESSTAYHRLSSELMVYGTALITGLKSSGFEIDLPDWLPELLWNNLNFTKAIMKPSGDIVQIGDNDSGRLFKITPDGSWLDNTEAEKKYENLKGYNQKIKEYSTEDRYFDENNLSINGLIAATEALFDNLKCGNEKFILEYSFVKSLTKGAVLPIHVNNTKSMLYIDKDIKHFEHITYNEIKSKSSQCSLTNEITLSLFPDFGLYVFKSPCLYLSVFAGTEGQNGLGGHSHNDKLSVELTINGQDILFDPGTYLYTPFPEIRDYYRTTAVHNTISVQDFEQAEFKNLFCKKNSTVCNVIKIDKTIIKLYFKTIGYQHIREIEILDNRIRIIDSCDKEFTVNHNNFEYYSNGYGKLIKKK